MHQHSELTDIEKIGLEYKGIQRAAELSLERLKTERRMTGAAMRALARDCKTYTSVVSRARKVAKVTGDDLFGTGLLRERLG